MPEPLSFYGSNRAAAVCGLNNLRVVAKIGDPCAVLRRGVSDCGLWSASRVMEFAINRQRTPGPENPPVYYSFPEAARFVGITPMVLGRIISGTKAPAIQVGKDMTFNLWSESFLWMVRKAIAEGRIYVRASSLTRPKMGVNVCSPRHTLSADQRQEAEAYRRANPYFGVVW